MTIVLECLCGKTLKAPDSKAGQRAKCPHCGEHIVVPSRLSQEEPLATGGDCAGIFDGLDDSIRDIFEVRAGTLDPEVVFSCDSMVFYEEETRTTPWTTSIESCLIGDFVFTNVGVLIKTRWRITLSEFTGASFKSYGAGVSGVIIESFRAKGSRHRIPRGYPGKSQEDVRFLPADEIELREAMEGFAFAVQFREHTIQIAGLDFMDMDWGAPVPSDRGWQRIEGWLKTARTVRTSLSHSPAKPTVAAFQEWLLRPRIDPPPPWIVLFVDEVADECKSLRNPCKQHPFFPVLGNLGYQERLFEFMSSLETPAASELIAMFDKYCKRGLLKVTVWCLFVLGVVILLVLINS